DYIQTNRYNGYGQRVEKSETVGTTTNTTNYFYDGSQILYTTDGSSNVTSFNMVGAEDNIILTGRPGDAEDVAPSFYVYTKDIRESTTNVIGTDGTAAVSYSYDTFGETTEYQQDEADPFYNEICYTAGVYDKTTGLYDLSARYYDPADGTFLTQDTYRGSRSRTATLNYYAYCAGNPVSYTDPSGHHPVVVAIAKIAGAALTLYSGYTGYKKGVNKAKSKGRKKAGQVATGVAYAAASMINPSKVASTAGKVVTAISKTKVANKVTTAVKNVVSKPKTTNIDSKNAKNTAKNNLSSKAGIIKKVNQSIHIPAPDLSKLPVDQAQDVVNSFKNGMYTNKTYSEGTVLYRVAGSMGDYWSVSPPPSTEAEWRAIYAILPEFKNDASKLYRITIPKGSSISGLDGYVGPQGNLPGGAHQVYLDSRSVPIEWIEVVQMEWK
ncbi:MAG: RHS repeat-associated core domain-containing protein, partial [Eubacterium sp.]|nr:RHS repeat-associated core domain-containing protein [Eubacterium sp.]